MSQPADVFAAGPVEELDVEALRLLCRTECSGEDVADGIGEQVVEVATGR